MNNRQTLDSLCSWFGKQLYQLEKAPTLHQCELLLCARELGVDSPRIRMALDCLVKLDRAHDAKQGRLLDAVMRQLVFTRFAIAQEERKRFLELWIRDRAYRGQDIIAVSFLIGLALEQQDLLEPFRLQYVRNWYLKHRDIRADRVRAWAPYHLMQAGHKEVAQKRAQDIMLSRGRNGSWSDDFRRTVACAYPLALSRLVPREDLEGTLGYILERLAKGLIDEVTVQAQALKLFAAVGLLPEDLVSLARLKLKNEGSIFLSYNRDNKTFVRHLASDLKTLGIRVWVDEGEILPGDSLLEKVEQGIGEMQYLGVVLSQASVRSPWVRKELRMAQARQLAEREIRVLPIVIEDCEIPLSLLDVCWADFRSTYNVGLEQLLRRLTPWAIIEGEAQNQSG